jgi:hypothetical protein
LWSRGGGCGGADAEEEAEAEEALLVAAAWASHTDARMARVDSLQAAVEALTHQLGQHFGQVRTPY